MYCCSDSLKFKRVLLLAGIMTMAGCSLAPSHIHSPEQLASAEKVQTELAAYSEKAPAMYTAMIANLAAFEVEEQRVVDDLIANRSAALVTSLPSTQLGKVNDKAEAVNTRLADLKTKVKEEAAKYLADKTLLTAELGAADGAVEAAKNAVVAAKAEVTNWNRTVALIQVGVSSLPTLGQDGGTDPVEEGMDTLRANLEKIAGTEVKYVDAEGKSKTETVRAILAAQPGSKDGAELTQLSLPDAPGSTLIILTLGLELAEIRKQRASYRLSQLAARAELYEDAYGGVLLSEQLLGDSKLPFDSTETKPLQRYVLEQALVARSGQKQLGELTDFTGQGLSNAAKVLSGGRSQMTATLEKVRYLTVADFIAARAYSIFTLSVARLNHQESIQLSQINDTAYMAALKGAAGSLVAYHKGGFTGEDAANIIRIAQAIAVGIIAGNV